LYAKSFGVDHDATLQPGQQSDETQFLFIAHSSLDIFEEKLANVAAPGAAADMYLGLLYPTDTYQVFGYVTNTKAKLVVITDDADVKDLDVKSVRVFVLCNACFVHSLSFRYSCANDCIFSTSMPCAILSTRQASRCDPPALTRRSPNSSARSERPLCTRSRLKLCVCVCVCVFVAVCLMLVLVSPGQRAPQ
jgi:hypothetical protein